MSVKKFRFVSPGIFINEIDNSQLPGAAEGIGPVVIGRAERGPGMRPITVGSFSEFVEMFGNPIPGGEGGDIWRDGNRTAPTYAAYAAQAWLRNAAPLTFIRLLGHEHDDATNEGKAGWSLSEAGSGGALGLFLGSQDVGDGARAAATGLGLTLTQDASGDAKNGESVVVTEAAAADLPGGPRVTIGGSASALTVQIEDDAGDAGAAAVSDEVQGITLTRDDVGVNASTVAISVLAGADNDGDNLLVDFAADGDNLTITITPDNDVKTEISQAELVTVINDGALAGVAVTGHGDVLFSAAGGAGDAVVDGTTHTFADGADARAAKALTTAELRQVLNGEAPAGVQVADAGSLLDAVTFSAAGGDGSEAGPATLTFADGADGEGVMALAAVIYHNGEAGNIGLVGEGLAGGVVAQDATDFALVKCQGNKSEVKIGINGKNYSVNFDPSSKKYIRKVLNTNPTLINNALTKKPLNHFLGETYDSHISAIGVDDLNAGSGFAILLPLDGTGMNKAIHQQEATAPKTGWIISQHQGVHDQFSVGDDGALPVERLFRFEGIDDGAWATQNIKIEISNITAPEGDFDPYGRFTVTLRSTKDSDQSPQYLERYSSVNLNPNSSDYLARRIGDMQTLWSYTENRYRTIGQYPCMSRFVRVVMNEDVDSGVADPSLIPFGFEGPAAPRTIKLDFAVDGSCSALSSAATLGSAEGDGGVATSALAEDIVQGIAGIDSLSLIFPAQGARGSSKEGRLSSPDAAVFGASSNETGTTRPDASYGEMLRPWSSDIGMDPENDDDGIITRSAIRSAGCFAPQTDDISMFDGITATDAQCRAAAGDSDGQGIVANFTLDDLVMENVAVGAGEVKQSGQHARWAPGSRFAGCSITVMDAPNTPHSSSDAKPLAEAEGTYKSVLDKGFDSFCLPLAGGSDGVDIKQKEPFSNEAVKDGAPQTNYAYNTVKRAIDSIADPEVVECNLAVIPGLTNKGLTGHLLTTCEARADALAIIDLEGDYRANTDNTESEAKRLPQVKTTVQNLKDRRLNSSYGCAYFPWVQVRDTINDAVLWAPPSVVALGTMASSQRRTEVWFAPAGFNRGGLTEGSAGLPVSQVRYRLTSKERDALYEANINPIATFPSEGIVIFGQKTLQVTPSALDRINVRRLMIYLKKEVSRIAATILFDQNTSVTWQRFIAQTEPFLASVKSRFGLSEFKVILDETTTTPDLVDRNVLYAKIMLKPARAIEYIALDFVISRSGASFED